MDTTLTSNITSTVSASISETTAEPPPTATTSVTSSLSSISSSDVNEVTASSSSVLPQSTTSSPAVITTATDATTLTTSTTSISAAETIASSTTSDAELTTSVSTDSSAEPSSSTAFETTSTDASTTDSPSLTSTTTSEDLTSPTSSETSSEAPTSTEDLTPSSTSDTSDTPEPTSFPEDDLYPNNYCLKIAGPENIGWISSGFGPGNDMFFRKPSDQSIPTMYFQRAGPRNTYSPLIGMAGAAAAPEAYDGWDTVFLDYSTQDDPGSAPNPVAFTFGRAAELQFYYDHLEPVMCAVAGGAPGSAATCRVTFTNGIPEYNQFVLLPTQFDRRRWGRRQQWDGGDNDDDDDDDGNSTSTSAGHGKRQEHYGFPQIMYFAHDQETEYSLVIAYDPDCGTYPEEPS
ncbi:hypothetical protein LQW54_010777 [Pestalotiopsis sp. IQ-011]